MELWIEDAFVAAVVEKVADHSLWHQSIAETSPDLRQRTRVTLT
jgi:hypothetical protein